MMLFSNNLTAGRSLGLDSSATKSKKRKSLQSAAADASSSIVVPSFSEMNDKSFVNEHIQYKKNAPLMNDSVRSGIFQRGKSSYVVKKNIQPLKPDFAAVKDRLNDVSIDGKYTYIYFCDCLKH